MNIVKFNENIKQKTFFENGKKVRNMLINSYNLQGYKLYYFENFNLIEITKVGDEWNKKWGKMIFFLDEDEYNDAMSIIEKNKVLYDKTIKQSELFLELHLSSIFYDILKLG